MGRGEHCKPEERRMIWKLRENGKTYKEIAGIMSCSQNMITNALKYQPQAENRGQKRKISAKMERRIVNFTKQNPFITSTALKKELNLEVSTSTIRKILIKNKLPARSPRKVPLLTPRHVKNRLKFAREHLNWPATKWRNVLWTDESKINLFGSDRGKQYVRRPQNQEFIPKFTVKTVKHGGGGILVWACFSYEGIGPIFWIKDIMDAQRYVHILSTIMLPYAEEEMPLRWLLQQDNDPKHTSKLAKKWFKDNLVQVMEWPAQSPDLNPIENLWHDVKLAIANKKFKNRDALWDAVEIAWNSIPVERCHRLIDSMHHRCAAVLKNHGHSTKY